MKAAHKAGASNNARPAVCPPAVGSHHGRRVFVSISKGGRATYYRGDLSTHRTVAEIDALHSSPIASEA